MEKEYFQWVVTIKDIDARRIQCEWDEAVERGKNAVQAVCTYMDMKWNHGSYPFKPLTEKEMRYDCGYLPEIYFGRYGKYENFALAKDRNGREWKFYTIISEDEYYKRTGFTKMI